MIEFEEYFYTKARYENSPTNYYKGRFMFNEDGDIVFKWRNHKSNRWNTECYDGVSKFEDFPITWETYHKWTKTHNEQISSQKEWETIQTRKNL